MAMVSATIGRYHIIEELGRGGMGVVYKGHDPLLNRPVAIKILSQQLVGNPEAKDRFIREAQASARLNHPNITSIYDINEHEGIYFIVFEFVSGTSLDKMLAEQSGPLSVPDALKIFVQICQALDYAHQHGVVHRDVKPGNVMLTGTIPFRADNLPAIIQMHLTQEPEPPTRHNMAIPRNVEQVVLRCMKKDPSERFQNVTDLLAALKTEEVPEDLYKTKISPSEAALHNILGNNYYKQGKLDLAILEWQKATQLDPYNALTHNNLGTALDGLGRLGEAVAEYRKA
ncbi:MAG TPA: protein kinase, partial [Candidatus Nitrosotenuis sp.]|nr:protein kinase [Candidatus Nitrosotenuis sp.]